MLNEAVCVGLACRDLPGLGSLLNHHDCCHSYTVVMTDALGGKKTWKGVRGGVQGSPRKFPVTLENWFNQCLPSIPGSTGEASGACGKGVLGLSGLSHVSEAPPGSPLSWPTSDSQGPALQPPRCPAGGPRASPQDNKMPVTKGTQCHFSKGLLLSGKQESTPGAEGGKVGPSPGTEVSSWKRERLSGKMKLLE